MNGITLLLAGDFRQTLPVIRGDDEVRINLINVLNQLSN